MNEKENRTFFSLEKNAQDEPQTLSPMLTTNVNEIEN